jgi:hypothetical protein
MPVLLEEKEQIGTRLVTLARDVSDVYRAAYIQKIL